jgi:hypothetical protein
MSITEVPATSSVPDPAQNKIIKKNKTKYLFRFFHREAGFTLWISVPYFSLSFAINEFERRTLIQKHAFEMGV